MADVDRRVVTLDAVMRTFGALLLAITTGLSTWALVQIVDLRERMARQETRIDSSQILLLQIRDDITDLRKIIMEKVK
jgi:cytochrome oxidase assembly protein ShyY1